MGIDRPDEDDSPRDERRRGEADSPPGLERGPASEGQERANGAARYRASVEMAYREYRADIERLQDSGFDQVETRNTWTSEQYMGINSRWREPASGQLIEIQFHTRPSFEAKQETHGAYERLRNPATTDDERDELKAFQRRACAHIPVPSGAVEIDDDQPEKRNG